MQEAALKLCLMGGPHRHDSLAKGRDGEAEALELLRAYVLSSPILTNWSSLRGWVHLEICGAM